MGGAVGDAALLEVARVLWGVRDKLHRGVRVAWWPAHSTGRYAGSTWFADEFAMELRDHCVAQIDVDSPGCKWATEYTQVMWMAEAEELARESIRAGAGAEAKGMRPLRAGDYSFNQIGLSSLFMLLSNIPEELAKEKGFYPVGGCGGNTAWHTEGDTLEVADAERVRALYLATGKREGLAAWVLLFYALWHRRHMLGQVPDGDVFDVLSQAA